MKIQKKYQGAIPLNRIANEHNESEINTYSTQYLNSKLCAVSLTQPTNEEKIWIKTSTNLLNTSPELSVTLSTDIACHLKKGTYTLVIDSATSTGGSYESYVGFKNSSGGTFLYTYIHYGTKYVTFTLEQDVKEISIWSQKYWDISRGVTTTFKNMRIVKGDKPLPYEPYTYSQILAQDSGGDYKEIYNKENLVSYLKPEQQIGTWIDNKPLYRRVYTGTVTQSGGALFNLPNINTHKAYGTVYLPTEYVTHPIGGYASSDYYTLLQINDGGDVKIFCSSIYLNSTYEIVIEYTKKDA